MGICETCGNAYDKSFDVVMNGRSHTFDSFECALARLSPKCGHCGIHILGHGVESEGKIFCCAHCAKAGGIRGLKDRLEDDRPEELQFI
jgi:hypothetical protein